MTPRQCVDTCFFTLALGVATASAHALPKLEREAHSLDAAPAAGA
jgi:hypothetical protein